MRQNNLQTISFLQSLLIIVISSSKDYTNEFPFYRGYSLAEELIEENASKDNETFCVRIVTDTGLDLGGGRLALSINDIKKFDETYFGQGQEVINTCFSKFELITVQNRLTVSLFWAGEIVLTNNGEKIDLECKTGCTGGDFSGTIVVSGGEDGTAMAPTWCLNGTSCKLVINEQQTTESTQTLDTGTTKETEKTSETFTEATKESDDTTQKDESKTTDTNEKTTETIIDTTKENITTRETSTTETLETETETSKETDNTRETISNATERSDTFDLTCNTVDLNIDHGYGMASVDQCMTQDPRKRWANNCSVSFDCLLGYRLEGKKDFICENGLWRPNEDPPTCVESSAGNINEQEMMIFILLQTAHVTVIMLL